jgi:cellulose synthase/poly-beta-1,6-N-acetylglucosamine synthase-like glycosyltransferase/Leucine-rich repeat (LRR) protein
MWPDHRIRTSVVCLLAALVACNDVAAQPGAGSAVLFDFEDDAQFARLRAGEHTKIEPSSQAHDGKRAARVLFAAVPAGTRAYPAVIVEETRDLTPFEALGLWVFNPGPGDAELSVAIRDKAGNRAFPVPSTFAIKPGKWEQVVTRLVLHGIDAKQVGSIHFYQKVNHEPVTLLIDDVQLLSPEAGRSAAQLRQVREQLKTARTTAELIGAGGHVEPTIAALARRLDDLEAATPAERARRSADLARIAKETQELAGSIRLRGKANNLLLTGPHVEARWLGDRSRLAPITVLTLRNTRLRDDDFPVLAAAQNLEVLVIEGKGITGAGLEHLTSDRLHTLRLADTDTHDEALRPLGKFFTLRNLDLANSRVTGGFLKHLAGLKQVKVLVLDDTQVSDAGFADVRGLTSLESLQLSRTKITGESLQHLTGLTRLKHLDLNRTRIDDAGLAHLGALKQLESLELEGTPIIGSGFERLGDIDKLVSLSLSNTRVGDSALRRLKLPRLLRLELSGTRITDASLQHIGRSTKLEYLDLYGTNVTDAGLAHLSGLRRLQELYLAGTQTSDAGLAHLPNLTALVHLDLEGTQVTDAGLAHLRGMKDLNVLKLGKTRINGPGLAQFAGLSQLQHLDLSGTDVTDEGLVHLARLPQLQTLLLNGTRVTNEGVRHLKAARRLTNLHLEATAVGDAGLEALTGMSALRALNLNETAVTDGGLKALKGIERLQSVQLNHTRITDAGLGQLGDGLTALELSHTRVTDQGVDSLRRMGRLEQLRLAATGVTNDALKSLRSNPGLRVLDLAETRVDDGGLHHLAALPELRDLNLNGTAVGDRGLDALLTLSGLQRLSLEDARVTASGLSYLKHRAPELKVSLDFPWVWGDRLSNSDVGRAEPDTLVEQLKTLTSLGYLRLDGAMLRPEALRSLKDLPTLEHLSFHGSSVTDEMLADLLGLSQVVRLDLSDTRVTDAGLVHLKDMQGLGELNLQGTRVIGAGLAHLADLHRLQALNLRDTPLTDDGLAHLSRLQHLRKLELSSTRVTDAGLDHLALLPGLQYLDLFGTAVTDAGAAKLSQMTALRYCYLSNTRLTDAAAEHLAKLTDLEELALDGTRWTDAGLGRLKPLTNLWRLRIGRTQVTDAGIETLRAMPGLRSLDLSGTRITDRSLPALGELPALTELDLRDTAVTPEAVAGFERTHPGVRVTAGDTRTSYSAGSIVLTAIYSLAALAICFYGLHRLWLAWLFVRDPQVRQSPEPKAQFVDLPTVTVQLPTFNERHVAERVIAAACALDYPPHLLQIQVLDDSTGESAEIVRACCDRLAAAGHRVELRHRSARDGFKGGALAAGLESATGEFVAVFDADFVPGPDFLRQTIHHFTDPAVGMVQAEWAHRNRGESLLTEVQAMFLDGHFVVEQSVRSRSGRWFNFNGTAGVWRRTCIDQAGGWQHDTLTEDTDLSYRALLRGWRFLYLPTVRCDGELPPTMTAFVGQQHRWSKGLVQTGRKLLPGILLCRAPLRVKLEAWFHLTAPVMYLVMFVVTAIALPAMFLATPFTDRPELALGVGLATLLFGTFAAAGFYLVSQWAQGFSVWRTLLKLPVLFALGVGLSAVNARAVLGGLLGFRSPFVRTPKFGGRRDLDPDPAARPRGFPPGLVELGVAGVLVACLVLSFTRPYTLIGAPFLVLFAIGYASVGSFRLIDRYRSAFRGAKGDNRLSLRERAPQAVARFAVGGAAAVFLAGVSALTLAIASPPSPSTDRGEQPVSLGLDLTTANWKSGKGGAVRHVSIDRGSLVLAVHLDEKNDQGEIALDLSGPLQSLGDSLGAGRRLAITVEYPSRFTGEFQPFVRDGHGRSEYGSTEFIEGHDPRRAVTVSLIPGPRIPAMGYQDRGFDPTTGIRQIGLKISAQSDRVRGPGYRPFRGTIRIARVRVTDVDRDTNPDPEVRPAGDKLQPLAVPSPEAFIAASGLDRPWPLGYGFSGPLTDAHKQELERTYAAVAKLGCRFTRVYVGDYRTGLLFDPTGKVAGVESDFLEYLDQLAATANRHGLTVMFSLTDNTLVDGRGLESPEFIRAGEPSEAFVNNGLAAILAKLKGRQVIWDVFNEPENATAVPLRDIQGYVDRVVAAGRQAEPGARFTVVSRSRPEVAYWRGRGLDLYSHNIFTERSLEEAVAEPRTSDAPLVVAEMAPALATDTALDALRRAGYSGVGLWGWGTKDKYQWGSAEVDRIAAPLLRLASRAP